MENFQNSFVSDNFCYDFMGAYQKNISNLLRKLRSSRKRELKWKRSTKDLLSENHYLRDEIIRLENSEDHARSLLSEKTKRLHSLEGISYNTFYKNFYRIKYVLNDGEEFVSNWYGSELEALQSLDSDISNFMIEKSYQKISWCENE